MTRQAPALARIPQQEKVRRRRDELADAALQTLGELGYARTSLREIAQNSEFSHGVVHYYFADKLELIAYCVRRYKEQCASKYDELVISSTDPTELRDGFAAALRHTMLADAAMHRLWYDMRAQSMFEPLLREDVRAIDARLEEMIAAVVLRYAQLSGAPAPSSTLLAYSALDGLFENCLVRHHAGDPGAAEELERQSAVLLTQLVPTAVGRA